MSESIISPYALNKHSTFYVAGHRGLVGGAIWETLQKQGFTNLIGKSSSELDLRDREAVWAFFEENRPEYVILAAAKVGGILANSTKPVDFLSDNLRIQLNVIDAALEFGVERFLFLGSSCIYPKNAPQPLIEDYLLTGVLEPTNDAYAIAKISGILHIQAMRRQYGKKWISAMPTNLYGPGDNFDPVNSHVLPALIRRYDEASKNNVSEVMNWGTGTPRREFMYVQDMAEACIFLLENYDGDQHVNIGTGQDCTIAEVADVIADATGFTGRTNWDTSKPDGMDQKLMDVTKINELGWKAKISLAEGIQQTLDWFHSHENTRRG